MKQDLDRLCRLSSPMGFESAEDINCPKISLSGYKDITISQAVMPNGKRINLLKTLLTSACERNCNYCLFRAGRDFRRETFKPEDLASTFDALHRAGIAEGAFLSSGIVGGGIRTQDKIIDTAEILRKIFQFRGYLHLKIMPGAEKAQVERAMQLADRVSINLEAPNDYRLAELAPKKNFIDELLQPLRWINDIRKSQSPHLGWDGNWPSSTTQFVVGAVDDTDAEILATTDFLYKELKLRRTYFMSFSPVPDTPLEHHAPTSAVREHRLYQASFLIRDYGFNMEEFEFNEAGNLPQNVDPKVGWARRNLQGKPVEINSADLQELIRIPGIGPTGAAAILRARKYNRITSLSQLNSLGLHTKSMAEFILLNGRHPVYQQSFW